MIPRIGWLKATAVTIIFANLLCSCSSPNDTKVLKLAHSLDIHHPVHKGIVYMAERVALHSGGKLTVDIYPSGQLGGERELMELLQIGSLAMTKVSTSPMEGFVPAMKVFSLPYVFKSHEHYWQVLDSPIGKELLLAGQSVRLRGLCYYDAGSRSFYAVDKLIRTPDDLTGMKIRVQNSQTAIQMVREFGGSATPISWGELYTALQQGVVDGAENNPPSFYSSKHFEVAKHFTLNEHTMVPDMLLISQYVWDRLSPEEQTWLQTAVDESVVYQKQLWAEATEQALALVKAAGVEVIVPDKTPFIEKVKGMHEAVRGTPAFEVLQRIKQLDAPAGDPAS